MLSAVLLQETTHCWPAGEGEGEGEEVEVWTRELEHTDIEFYNGKLSSVTTQPIENRLYTFFSSVMYYN